MNFEDYKNKLDLPRKTHFVTKYFYRQGQVVAVMRPGDDYPKGVDLSGCVNDQVINEDAYATARDHYSRHERQLAEMFVVDLLHDFGMPDNEFTRRMYEIAYANGHASGYASIYSCFEDLAELDSLAKKTYGK